MMHDSHSAAGTIKDIRDDGVRAWEQVASDCGRSRSLDNAVLPVVDPWGN